MEMPVRSRGAYDPVIIRLSKLQNFCGMRKARKEKALIQSRTGASLIPENLYWKLILTIWVKELLLPSVWEASRDLLNGHSLTVH
jgi:hypothetical protein